MKTIRCLLPNGLVISMITVFVLLSSVSSFAAGTPKEGGVFKILLDHSYYPRFFGYPPKAAMGALFCAQATLERLVRLDRQGQPVPELATSWKIAADKKSIIFKLRKGVGFHDGTEFNAEAVKFNYDLSIEAGEGKFSSVDSVDVLDSHTVRLNLNKFENGIFANLDMAPGFIVSPTAIKTKGAKWAQTHPIGTGPFMLIDSKRDVHLKFKRFDSYWGKRPYLDEVQYLFFSDPMTLMAAFEREGGHVILQSLKTNKLAELRKKGYKILQNYEPSYSLIGDSVNKDSVYSNKKVREAIEYAINRDAIVNQLGNGFMKVMKQFAMEGSMGYNPGLKAREYNPEKAKQLLKEAGYPNGFKTTIISWAGRDEDVFVAIQNQLGMVGIKAHIQFVNVGRWVDLRMNGWKNSLLLGLAGIEPNYTVSINDCMGPDNPKHPSLVRPAGWRKVMYEAMGTLDPVVHKSKTQELVAMIHEDASLVPLLAASQSIVLNKNVRDSGFLENGWPYEWRSEKTWIAD